MMRIADIVECNEEWRRCLTTDELARFEAIQVPKRRHDWLAGRVAAKHCCASRHGLVGVEALREIEIVAITEGPERGRPTYRVHGETGPYCLSITHSGDYVAAALARTEGSRLGIDIEHVERRDASFEELVLSRDESQALHALAGDSRALAVTRLFALKEAVTKALGCGLRISLPGIRVAICEVSGEPALGDVPFVVERPFDITGYQRARASVVDHDAAVFAWVVLD